MNLVRYLAGVGYLVVSIGPVALGAVRWRQRLLPDARGANARTVEAVVGFSVFFTTAHVLGTAGLFERIPMLVALFVLGTLAALAARPTPTRVATSRHAFRDIAIAAVVVALVVALWAPQLSLVLRSGPVDVDSQNFHMPMVAEFVQTGVLTNLKFFMADFHIAYYPYDANLVHAFGFLAFGRDVLTPFVNLGWLALTLLAGWSVARTTKGKVAALAAIGVVVAGPTVVLTQPGGAVTDVAGLFFFVASVVVLLDDRSRAASFLVAGLAAGSAIAIKQSFIAPVAFLTLAVLVDVWRERRPKVACTTAWIVPLVVNGSFWYLRNWVRIGNPVPGIDVGPFTTPRMRLLDLVDENVAHYAFDFGMWRRVFVPGLSAGFSRAWPILFAGVAAAGLWALLRGRDPFTRGAGAVALAIPVAFAFTPTTAGGSREGTSEWFYPTLRYLLPALALSALVGVVVAERTTPRMLPVLTGAAVVLIVVAGRSVALVTVLAFVLVLGIAIAVYAALRLPRRLVVVAAAAAALGVVAAGYVVSNFYLDRRYTPAGKYTETSPDAAVAFALADAAPSRVGLGTSSLIYPLFGPDLRHAIDYVGDLRSSNEFTDYRTCELWRRAVNEGDYDYIYLTTTYEDYGPPLHDFVRSADGAELVSAGRDAYLYRITGELEEDDCRDDAA